MSREWTLAEQERDEYEACMLQHADDLALYQAEQRMTDPVRCERHGVWDAVGLGWNPECPGCALDDERARERDRERFDPPRIPVVKKPAA